MLARIATPFEYIDSRWHVDTENQGTSISIRGGGGNVDDLERFGSRERSLYAKLEKRVSRQSS